MGRPSYVEPAGKQERTATAVAKAGAPSRTDLGLSPVSPQLAGARFGHDFGSMRTHSGGPPAVDPGDGSGFIELMAAIDTIQAPQTPGQPHTLTFRGVRFTLSSEQLAMLRSAAQRAISEGVRKAMNDLANARGRYEAQQQVEREHYVVAPIVKFFSGSEDPGEALAARSVSAGTESALARKLLQANQLAGAAEAFVRCESAVLEARRAVREYVDKIISTGETSVRVLQYTRDASFITLGVLATIATAGAAAGATTTLLGMEVGTVATASTIAFGAPVVATVGESGMKAALGEQVDWTRVAVDAVVSLVLARFGGKLSTGLLRALSGNAAVRNLPRLVFDRVVSGVLTYEAAQAFLTAVNVTYQQLRGRPVTWEQFTDELLVRMTDPRGLVLSAVLGAVQAGVEHRVTTGPGPGPTGRPGWTPEVIRGDGRGTSPPPMGPGFTGQPSYHPVAGQTALAVAPSPQAVSLPALRLLPPPPPLAAPLPVGPMAATLMAASGSTSTQATPGAKPKPATQAVGPSPRPSGAAEFVADSNIFMDRQISVDVEPVKALLNAPGVTLYVPDAAWQEVLSGDKFGTQSVRLQGLKDGARVVHDQDGDLSGIDEKLREKLIKSVSASFDLSDMRIVHRAKERMLPLVTVNRAMFNQVQQPPRSTVWGSVLIVSP